MKSKAAKASSRRPPSRKNARKKRTVRKRYRLSCEIQIKSRQVLAFFRAIYYDTVYICQQYINS